MMNKYDLKDQLYKMYDQMDNMTGKMMSPGCEDEETGKLRAEAYTILMQAAMKLKELGNSIY